MGNLNLFPTIVGKARIRNALTNGVFFDLDCATSIKPTFDGTDRKTLNCGNGDSISMTDNKATVSMKIVKTKNPDLLGKLYNLAVTSAVAGPQTITNEAMTFEDDKIEIRQRSTSDSLGVTSIVVKSAVTGGTTYSTTTDYTTNTVNGKTTITRVAGGTIPSGATVYISGSYNTNAFKKTNYKRIRKKNPQFSIEIFGQDETTGKYTILYISKAELNSSYLLEMIDMFRDGDIAGAELTFELMDMGDIEYIDENI